MPVRGVMGLALTAAGLAMLLSFRPPDVPGADLALAISEPAPATDELLPATPPTVPADEASSVTLVGSAIDTRWGNVQVQVIVQGDRIVGVDALQLPAGDRRSQRISERAEPVLREQAIQRGSADVDVVSGATYTSLGYAYSLQSALDQLSA
jgi:uncharacterized protein with FMN-binding domain